MPLTVRMELWKGKEVGRDSGVHGSTRCHYTGPSGQAKRRHTLRHPNIALTSMVGVDEMYGAFWLKFYQLFFTNIFDHSVV